ncbi:hypothetical protein B0H19DRAFT_1268346 [Mycena capillaripes]|nr:hypothetical protein B0H19DRAFT_1268346 [Mycena capillaripes]
MLLSPLTSLLNFIRDSRSPESLHRYMAVVELYRALQESLAGHELETMRHAAFKSLEQIDTEEVDKMVLYQHALSLKETAVKYSPPLLTEKGRNAIDAFKARWAEAHEKDKDALGGLHNSEQLERPFRDKQLEICRGNGDPEESLKTWTALLVAWHKNRANTRHTHFSVKLHGVPERPPPEDIPHPSVRPTSVVVYDTIQDAPPGWEWWVEWWKKMIGLE